MISYYHKNRLIIIHINIVCGSNTFYVVTLQKITNIINIIIKKNKTKQKLIKYLFIIIKWIFKS